MSSLYSPARKDDVFFMLRIQPRVSFCALIIAWRTYSEDSCRSCDCANIQSQPALLGSVHWILGGSVRGGRIVGEQIRLQAGNLFQNRDYPVLNDYRGVLAGLFQRLWGLSPARQERMFPSAPVVNLDLV
jgi:Protein of unknown function (DUF1501)